jgi:hypothetical protein
VFAEGSGRRALVLGHAERMGGNWIRATIRLDDGTVP